MISCAIEKYGKENFRCEIIYQSKDYEHCRKIEAFFVHEYNTLTDTQGGHGYNIDFGGTGHKRSQETIEKHRQKIKGRPQSEEHKRKKAEKITGENNGMFGRKGELHHHYGKKLEESHNNKLQDARQKNYELNGSWNKGIPMSEEQNRRLQEGRANKAPKYSEVVIETPSREIVKLNGKNYLEFLSKNS